MNAYVGIRIRPKPWAKRLLALCDRFRPLAAIVYWAWPVVYRYGYSVETTHYPARQE